MWVVNVKAHSQVWDKFWQLKPPLKMMENAFYFTLKALFALKIFTFLFSLFSHVEKRFNEKDQVNFKFVTSQPRK